MGNIVLNTAGQKGAALNAGDRFIGGAGDQTAYILTSGIGNASNVDVNSLIEVVQFAASSSDMKLTYNALTGKIDLTVGTIVLASVQPQVDGNGTQIAAKNGSFFLKTDLVDGQIVAQISDGKDGSTFKTITADYVPVAADIDTSKPSDIGGVVPGPTPEPSFVLTENIETITGNAENNTFNAAGKFIQGSGTTVNTFQSGDVVDGFGGENTIVIQAVQNTVGSPIVATLKDVQHMKLTSLADTAIEATNFSGLQDISLESSTATTTFTNLGNVVDLSVKHQTAVNVTLGYTGEALLGANTQKITLNNVQRSTTAGYIQFEDNSGVGTLEALDITVTGASKISGIKDATAGTNVLAGVTTITVDAQAAADLGAIDTAKLLTFDASKSTAGVTANISAATGDITVTGGAGDDNITMGETLTDKDVIDLGAGNNTLGITGDANKNSYNVSNIQNLSITTNANNNVVNAGAFGTGVEAITVTSAADAHAITLNNVANNATVKAMDLPKDVGGIADTLTALTIAGKNTVGSDDTVNVKLFSNEETGKLDAPAAFIVTTLTTTGFENVKITSEGLANTKNTIGTFTDTQLKNLTITGDKLLEINSTVNAVNVNASESTGGVALTLGGTTVSGGKQTVAGGSGKDTFTIAHGNLSKDIKIDGGAGVDKLAISGTLNDSVNWAGVANAEKISGVSNIEELSFNGLDLTIDSATMDRFTNSTLNAIITGSNATKLDSSGVLSSTSKINVDASKMDTTGFTFTIGNSIDTFKGSVVADEIIVTNSSYLLDSDAFDGGITAVNKLTLGVVGTADQSFQASQFAQVSNFSTWQIQDSSTPEANKLSVTLSNTVVGQNADIDGKLTIINTAYGDSIVFDASSVGSGYKLIVSTAASLAAAKDQVYKLGAGDDTITLNSAADAVAQNKITLGEGKDTVKLDASVLSLAATGDTATNVSGSTITDFNFGAHETAENKFVDRLDVKAFNLANATSKLIGKASAGSTANANIIVLDTAAYDKADSLLLAVQGSTNLDELSNNLLVFWQDTLGTVKMGMYTHVESAGDVTGSTIQTSVNLSGVTIQGVAANLDIYDIITA